MVSSGDEWGENQQMISSAVPSVVSEESLWLHLTLIHKYHPYSVYSFAILYSLVKVS